MTKTKRKGFTIIELVIVIAIIAILAAVLIPTFANIISKAQTSADLQVVREMNRAVDLEFIGDDKPATAHDARTAVIPYGYDWAKIAAKNSKLNILWNSKTGGFVLVNKEDGKFVYPTENSTGNGKIEDDKDKINFFKVVDNKADSNGFSIYAGEGWTEPNPSVEVGFDAGDFDVTEVTYENNSSQDVVIRTNSASTNLGLNAPNGDVYLFGKVGKICGVNTDGSLDETAGAVVAPSSLHIDENAEVAYIKIAQGHIENKGTIDLIYATSSDVTVTNTGDIDHAHGSKEVAKAINGAGTTTGVKFDYNENTEQNNDPEVYHHVTEGTEVAGNKPVTGTETWAEGKVDTAAEEVVDTASGKIVLVKQSGKEDIKVSLDKFRDNWNDGEYYDSFISATLTADADISGSNWFPIGTWRFPFHGTLDGNGKTINGLTARSIDADHIGLYSTGDTVGTGEVYGFIGIVGGGDVEVKSITLKDVEINIYNGQNVGALMGYAPKNGDFSDAKKGGAYWASTQTEGKKIVPDHYGKDKITISDVTISGLVSAQTHVGGFVGKIYAIGATKLENCVNKTQTIATDGDGAGFIGYASGITDETSSITFDSCENKQGSSIQCKAFSDFVYVDNKSLAKTIVNENCTSEMTLPTFEGEIPAITVMTFVQTYTLNLQGNKATNTITNYGKMVIEDGTFEGKITTYGHNQGCTILKGGIYNCVVSSQSNAKVHIEGGTFQKYADAAFDITGSMEITGGDFGAIKSDTDTTPQIFKIAATGNLVTKGATVSPSGSSAKSNACIYINAGGTYNGEVASDGIYKAWTNFTE